MLSAAKHLVAACVLACHAAACLAAADDARLEARMARITSELRCLVCQNETIAASQADLAVDLRQQIRQRLQAGESPDHIPEDGSPD